MKNIDFASIDIIDESSDTGDLYIESSSEDLEKFLRSRIWRDIIRIINRDLWVARKRLETAPTNEVGIIQTQVRTLKLLKDIPYILEGALSLMQKDEEIQNERANNVD